MLKYLFITIGLMTIILLLFAYGPAGYSKYIFWFQSYIFPAEKAQILPDGTLIRGNIFPSHSYTGKWEVWDESLTWVHYTGNFVDGIPSGEWTIFDNNGHIVYSVTANAIKTKNNLIIIETSEGDYFEKWGFIYNFHNKYIHAI